MIELQQGNPFFANFYGAFKDSARLFLAMEYIIGGELYNFMTERNGQPFSEREVAFVVGSVTMMIEFIHSRGFVYRDLKPENIMIGQDGFLKLIDFGFCKALASTSDRTYTPCGTIEYMAPEVLTRLGHGFEADWWSVGVLMFECYHMCTPFVVDDTEADDTTIIKRVQNPAYVSQFAAPTAAPPFTFDKSATPEAIALMLDLMQHDMNARFDVRALLEFCSRPPSNSHPAMRPVE